jgi:hypothetical protein
MIYIEVYFCQSASIDTEKIMMNEHGGLPRCNKTTCKTACMEFVEY